MRMRLFAGLAALSTLAPGPRAWGYMVQHTSDGQEVRWFRSEVTYYINTDGFEDFEASEIQRLVEQCFQTWEAETFGVDFIYAGETDVKVAEHDGYNTVYFVQDSATWLEMFPTSEFALAMARTQAEGSSGEIVGFDIVFNDATYFFTNTDDPSLVEVDFKNTLTHEIGHVLGLEHSEVPEAVMYATSAYGDMSNRVLAQDDRDAIAYLYRERETTGCGGTFQSSTGAQGAGGVLLPILFSPLLLRRRKKGG